MNQQMKDNCDCCSKSFETLDIRVIVPLILNDKIQDFQLCRPCFLESDEMTFSEFMKYRANYGKEVEEKE